MRRRCAHPGSRLVTWRRLHERLANLPGDVQCFVESNRTLRDTVRERWSFHELQHESAGTVCFFEPMDLRDVRMIERREDLRFALEASEPLGIVDGIGPE